MPLRHCRFGPRGEDITGGCNDYEKCSFIHEICDNPGCNGCKKWHAREIEDWQLRKITAISLKQARRDGIVATSPPPVLTKPTASSAASSTSALATMDTLNPTRPLRAKGPVQFSRFPNAAAAATPTPVPIMVPGAIGGNTLLVAEDMPFLNHSRYVEDSQSMASRYRCDEASDDEEEEADEGGDFTETFDIPQDDSVNEEGSNHLIILLVTEIERLEKELNAAKYYMSAHDLLDGFNTQFHG